MLSRLTLPALLFLAACSGEVLVSEPGASSSSGVATGGSGGSGGSGSSGSVGTSGGTSGGGGAGGSPACKETHDHLDIVLSSWDGKTYACSAGAGERELNGVVMQAPSSGLFVLDSCPPNADCVGQLSKLSLSAPGIQTNLPPGTFVRVHVSIQPFMGGCAQRVQIKNLSSWGGEANPIQNGELLWFYGMDGDPSVFPDTPFHAEAEPLGCFPDAPVGCGGHDDYTWRFKSLDDPKDPGATVGMGQSKIWDASLDGHHQEVLIHNLRSYSIGVCDGPVDLAYWITYAEPLD
jgi:hypothetical protein